MAALLSLAALLAAAHAALLAEFFPSYNLETSSTAAPVATRTDATVDFTWPASPEPGVPDDQWSARWTGAFVPLETAAHTFCVDTATGARLWIDNQLVVNNWIPPVPGQSCAVVDLVDGERVNVRLEYFDFMGPGSLSFSYSTPSTALQVVPAAQTEVVAYTYERFAQLVLDGGCEDGALNGWVVASGTWRCDNDNLGPRLGNFQFHQCCNGDPEPAEIYRDVSIAEFAFFIDAGAAVVVYEGFHRSDNGLDSSRAIVEFRDADDNILGLVDTGSIFEPAWTQVFAGGFGAMPRGARVARIRLQSTIAGENSFSLAFIDGINLVVQVDPAFTGFCHPFLAFDRDIPRGLISDAFFNYGSSWNCRYTFVPVGLEGIIQFRVLSVPPFATEEFRDILRFFDDDAYTTELAALSGGPLDPAQSTVVTTGPTASLRFSSDSSTTDSGFVVEFHALDYPLVDSIAPTGADGPGVAITITGSRFGSSIDDLAVSVGGAPCLGLAFVVPGSVLTCDSPAQSLGPQDVVVSHLFADSQPPHPSIIYFVAPAVSAVVPAGGVAGAPIRIDGSDFGLDQGIATVTIGSFPCTPSEYSQTAITCAVSPTATGSDLAVSVSLYGLPNAPSTPVLYSFVDQPSVAGIFPPMGQVDTVLTVTGADFGTDQDVLSVTIGDTPCQLVPGSLVAGSSVQCRIPARTLLAPLANPVTLRIYDTAAPEAPEFTYIDTPEIISVAPRGGILGPTLVTMVGSFLGDDESALDILFEFIVDRRRGGDDDDDDGGIGGPDFVPCVIVPGSLQATVGSRSELQCTVDPTTITSPPFELIVRVVRFTTSSLAPFPEFQVIQRPTAPTLVPPGGQLNSPVTVQGSNLGFSASDLDITIGGEPCAIVFVNDAAATCLAPDLGTNGFFPVVVTRYDVPTLEPLQFQNVIPSVASISPLGGLPGTALTITPSPGALEFVSPDDLVIRIGGVRCDLDESVEGPGDPIVCEVGSTSRIGPQGLIVSHLGIEAPPVTFQLIRTPTTTALAPEGAAFGSVIRLTGTNFGVSADDVAVVIGADTPCPVVPGSVGDSTLLCTLPAAGTLPPGSQTVALSRFGVAASSTQSLLLFATPVVDSVAPLLGQGDFDLTLSGTFGDPDDCDEADFSVTVGGAPCPILSFAPSCDQLVCRTPARRTGPAEVLLFHFDSPSAANANSFQYLGNPTLDTVAPQRASQGTVLVLSGSAFGASEADIAVSIPGVDCPIIPGSFNALDGEISCTVGEPGAGVIGTTQLVTVLVAGVPSLEVDTFVILESLPLVAAVAPRGALPGDTVTITGTNLGTPDDTISVLVGGQPCAEVAASSAGERYECTLDASTPQGVAAVALTRNGQASLGAASVVVLAPFSLLGIAPDQGSAGEVVQIEGDGAFGGAAPGIVTVDDVAVFVGAARAPCAVTDFQSLAGGAGGDVVECVMPPGVSNSADSVVVTLFEGVDSSPTVFTFREPANPVIVGTSPAGARPGSTVVVTGGGFGSTESELAVTIAGSPAAVVPGSLNAAGSRFSCVVPADATEDPDVAAQLLVTVDGSAPAVAPFFVLPAIELVAIDPPLGALGNLLTVTATGLGTDEAALAITIGSIPCQISSGSLSGAEVQCFVPVGTLGPSPVSVERFDTASLASPLRFAHTQVPLATSLSPAGGLPGDIIAVAGAGFGDDAGAISVLFGGIPAVTIAGVTDTEVLVAVPDGVVSSAVVVSRFQLAANPLDFVVPATPTVLSASPTVVVAGTEVTFVGDNFGASEVNLVVRFGGERASIVPGSLNTLGTTFKCIVPVPAGGVVDLAVVSATLAVFSAELELTDAFTYILPPTTTGVAPALGIPGTLVTLGGSNFGPNADLLSVTVGGAAANIVPGSVTDGGTELVFEAPEGSPGQRDVVLSRGSAVAPPPTVVFEYIVAPVVSAVLPLASRSGSPITLLGEDFGSDEAALAVTVDGSACELVQDSLDAFGSQVTCILPAGLVVGDTYTVFLTKQGVAADGGPAQQPSVAAIELPSVDAIEPEGGREGTLLTITGTALGGESAGEVPSASVTIGGADCPLVAGALSSEQLVCRVPVLSRGERSVIVRNYGLKAASAPTFTVAANPLIDQIIPTGGPASGSMLLTVIGSGFGDDAAALRVQIGTAGVAECPVTRFFADDRAFECLTPAVPEGPHNVFMARWDVLGLGPFPLFEAVGEPQVDAISQLGGIGGETVELSGLGFGADEAVLTASVDGVPALVVPGSLNSAGTVVSVVMPDVSLLSLGSVGVTVSRYGVESLPVPFEYIPTPEIDAVYPAGGLSGSLLTVSGSTFGTDGADVEISVGGAPCPIRSLSTPGPQDLELVCTVPVGLLGAQPVVLTRFGVPTAGAASFVYFSRPVLLGITPEGGRGDSAVVLTGSSFGPDAAQLSIVVDGEPCAIDSASLNAEGTRVACSMPPVVLSEGQTEQLASVRLFRLETEAVFDTEFLFVATPATVDVEPRGGQPGTTIVVYGNQFGDDADDVTVTVGGAPCVVVPSSLLPAGDVPGATQRVSCIAPDQALGPRRVVVKRFGVASVDAVDFEYVDLPVVLEVTPRGTLPDALVTVSGLNFGNNTGDLAVSLGRGGEELPIVSLSNATLVAEVPADVVLGTYHVVVTRLGDLSSVESALDVFSIVEPPLVLGVSPDGGGNGARVTVAGRRLGNDNSQLEVRIGDQRCLQVVLNAIGTSAECTIPELSVGVYGVEVVRFGEVRGSNASVSFELLLPPRVTALDPLGGGSGAVVLVAGTGFGTVESDLTLYLGGEDGIVLSVLPGSLRTFLSQDTVSAVIPAIDVEGAQVLPVTVCRFGSLCSTGEGVDAPTFELVEAPTVLDVAPLGGIGGQTITVFGRGFGQSEAALRILVNDEACPIVPLTLASDGRSVQCRAPSVFGLRQSGDRSATVSARRYDVGSVGGGADFVYIETPVVESVSPRGGQAGDVVTVYGVNFGSDAETLSVSVGGSACDVIGFVPAADAESADAIECRVSGSFLGSQDVEVQRFEVVSEINEDSSFLVVDTPAIITVEPEGGFPGDLVTIQGRRFGSGEDGLQVVIGDVECPIVEGSFRVLRMDGDGSDADTDPLLEDQLVEVQCVVSESVSPADVGPQTVRVFVFGVASAPPNPEFFYVLSSELYFVRPGSAEGIAFLIMIGLTGIVLMGLFAVVFLCRHQPVIMAASPTFCMFILMGGLVYTVGVLTLIGRPDEHRCLAQRWLPSIGFNIIMSNLFVKTWRIWRILDHTKLRHAHLKNRHLVVMSAILLAVDVAILTVWTRDDPAGTKVLFGEPSSLVCTADLSPYVMALGAYKFVLLAFGCLLAYATRGVQSLFNESRDIAIAVYTVFLVSLLALPVVDAVSDGKAVFAVQSIAHLLVIWVTIGAVFVPKVYHVYNNTGNPLEGVANATVSADEQHHYVEGVELEQL